jgi:hypothetical protein
MTRFSRSYKICISYTDSIPNCLMFRGHHISILHGFHTKCLCWFNYFLWVLINTSRKHDFSFFEPLKSCDSICNKGRIGMTNMRHTVGVVYWRCYEKCIFWHRGCSKWENCRELYIFRKRKAKQERKNNCVIGNFHRIITWKKHVIHFFKNIFIATIVAGVFFSAGYLFGWQITPKEDTKQENTDISRQERDMKSYKYISPLLECDITSWDAQQKYIPFEKELKEKIEEAIIKNNPDIHVSLYFRNLNNWPWFWINEEEWFAPASLMKLPIAMSYMKWAETDPSILTKEFQINRETASVQNYIPEEQLSTWSTYNVLDLISRALIYSDNDANRTLMDNIPENILMWIFGDLWIPIVDELEKWVTDYISVKEYASFFRILYNASYIERSSSEKLLEILSQSKFQNWLIKNLPSTVPVAHKFWEREFYSPELGKNIFQLHDCGVVYYKQYPYLLCIMTKGASDFKTLGKVIQDISWIVFDTIHRLYP